MGKLPGGALLNSHPEFQSLATVSSAGHPNNQGGFVVGEKSCPLYSSEITAWMAASHILALGSDFCGFQDRNRANGFIGSSVNVCEWSHVGSMWNQVGL